MNVPTAIVLRLITLTSAFTAKNVAPIFQSKIRKSYFFQEKVQALELSDFGKLLADANFEILQLAGNYQLEAFDLEQSDRLILICKKK